jgi:bifunctional non-homologous end joining protein LigD
MADQTLTIDGHSFGVTNLSKVLYPATGTTKHDVLSYYVQVAEVFIKHAGHRIATRKRWPDGVETKPFFEKNLPSHAPNWIQRATLAHSKRDVTYPLVNNAATLLWLVQGAALEIHTPQWCWDEATNGPQQPDRLVIDLDPGPGTRLADCCEVAIAARDLLASDGLAGAVPVTSGSKGMHLYVSLPQTGPPDSNVYAKGLAKRLQEALPKLAISTMARSERTGKVFIDWSQNNRSKTTISPYSLRGRSHPMVAAPRTWDEIESRRIELLMYTEVLARLADLGDLFTMT